MRIPWVPILIVALATLIAFQQYQLSTLRTQLANSLINKDILEKALKDRATADKPVVVNVTPAGTTVPVPVRVFIDRGEPRSPSTPTSTPSPPQVPRLVAEAPPIPCKTAEECKRIFGAAPQAVSVSASIRAGTVVPVTLNGQTVNLPLAADVPFTMNLVLSERGVFHALEPAGGPLKISQVRTETQIVERQLAPELPYHLSLFARVGSDFAADVGIRYVNRIMGGFYEIEPRFRMFGPHPGFGAALTFVLPLR